MRSARGSGRAHGPPVACPPDGIARAPRTKGLRTRRPSATIAPACCRRNRNLAVQEVADDSVNDAVSTGRVKTRCPPNGVHVLQCPEKRASTSCSSLPRDRPTRANSSSAGDDVVANTTSSINDAFRTAEMTCRTTGRPPKDISTFPGRRSDEHRACITHDALSHGVASKRAFQTRSRTPTPNNCTSSTKRGTYT